MYHPVKKLLLEYSNYFQGGQYLLIYHLFHKMCHNLSYQSNNVPSYLILDNQLLTIIISDLLPSAELFKFALSINCYFSIFAIIDQGSAKLDRIRIIRLIYFESSWFNFFPCFSMVHFCQWYISPM